jgi:oligopeptide/dipeptide ABC transporter ATP-binding protein
VTCAALLRLLREPPAKITAKTLSLGGHDVLAANNQAISSLRGRVAAMVFQDPMTSLDPVFTIGDQIAETIQAHRKVSKKEALAEAVALLRRVEIKNPEAVVRYYPHQLSGGMLQRAMIAMALSCQPDVLIADEPTTALDVTIQAQILQLIKDIQVETGMGLIMITHDLGVVAETVDRVVVMYGGKVMETGPVEAIFEAPLHPYTKALLNSMPGQVAGKRRLVEIPGSSPNPSNPPPGCPFHPRCPISTIECKQIVPPLETVDAGSQVACIKVA